MASADLEGDARSRMNNVLVRTARPGSVWVAVWLALHGAKVCREPLGRQALPGPQNGSHGEACGRPGRPLSMPLARMTG